MQHTTPTGYEQKFENFIKLCEKAKAEGVSEVIVAQPWVIGDTYDEVIESLTRLAAAGLALHIARP
jgi:dihydrodipicolinate synthase/N-acetylneuraminate lyase